MRVPASLIAIPLLVGCALAIGLGTELPRSLAVCAAAGAVVATLAACAWCADGFAPGVVGAVACGCLLCGVSLAARAVREAYGPALLVWYDTRPPDGPALLEGTLREDATLTPAGVTIAIDVRCGDFRPCGRPADRRRGLAETAGVRLGVAGLAGPGTIDEWRAGRTVRVHALLRRPGSFGDPGVPDDARALARRGIVLVGSVKSAALVDVIARGGIVQEAAASARAWARRQLARHVGRWRTESGAIVSAILIGDRSGLSEEDERRLQEAGTYHVIAISGGNIAILTALLLFTLRAAGLASAPAAVVVIAVLLFYAQIAGAGASVSRAVTAACIFLGGRIVDHRGPPLNALAIAAIAAVAGAPLAVADAGFLLSFGATLGILVGVPRILGRRETREPVRWRRLAGRAATALSALFAATACAELALAPVSATLFSRVTIAGLALNFVAIPFMTVAQVASLSALAWAPLADGAAAACGRIAHLAAWGLVRSSALVDVAPWLAIDVARPAWWTIVAYYASCAALFASSRRAIRAGASGVAISAVLILGSPAIAARDRVRAPPPATLRVVFLDVGQGDATLAVLPSGRAILIDAGGLAGSSFDLGERVLAPSLRALGVFRLDTLVLTHGDPDHIGGAPVVLKRFQPRSIWEGVPVPPHAALRELAGLASSAGTSWRTVQAGDYEVDAAVSLRLLHPPPPEWERQRVRNDDSIVVELRLGDVTIVLPGDIAREGEEAVIPRLRPGRLTIVKAPHHGSATSSTAPFVNAARPSAVIFSAGRANRFGHPVPAVVDRYRQAGALVFRTDEDGAIVMETDGRVVRIATWSGRLVSLSPPGYRSP